VQKVEKLRQLGVSFDEKLTPLLNADQQQKFQAMREAFRRRMIEEMAEKALQKVESKVNAWFTIRASSEQDAVAGCGIRDSGCEIRVTSYEIRDP
jgi:hypothetical protein